jgi:hypothetical protein
LINLITLSGTLKGRVLIDQNQKAIQEAILVPDLETHPPPRVTATAEAEAIVQITSANPGIPHHKERLKPHTMLSIALLTTKLKTSSNQAISETSGCSTTPRMISTSKQVTLIP